MPVARPRRSRSGCGRAGVGRCPAASRGCGLRGRAGRPGRGRVRDARASSASTEACSRRSSARSRRSGRRGIRASARPARRFTALAAASVARPGQILLVAAKEEEEFLEPLPLSLLPMTPNRYAELEGLGLRSLGELAQLPSGAVAERLGVEGRKAWRLAHGGRKARVRGRKPASELVEALSFPEAIANELTLRRALGSLLERLLARPERAGRPFRKLALVARLVDGGSWRRVATLRDATAELGPPARGARAEAAGAPGADRRAPARGGRARGAHGPAARARRAGGGGGGRAPARRAAAGAREHGVGVGVRVVEVAPWSRVPEARALVVPKDV